MRQDIREGMRRVWSSDLQNIVGAIRNKTLKYEEKDNEPINWKMYDKAQINELADILDAIRVSVDIATGRITPKIQYTGARFPGRPEVIADSSVAKLLLLQTYFGTSNRVSEGLLRVFDAKLGINDRFSYKTLERGYDPESVGRILDEVFVLTNKWGNFNEDTFGIDGSGDPTTMKINYESKRANQRRKKALKTSQEVITVWPTIDKRKDFQYSVLSCGRHTKIIAGFSTTENHHISELSRHEEIIKETKKNAPKFKILLGDTLYANRKVCRTTVRYNVALYSIPRSNSTVKSKGVKEWSRMTYELILDPLGFLSTYHGRSISETVNSMLKRREPTKLRKRLSGRRATEEQLKVIIHNLRQCGYLTYLAPELVRIPVAE